MSDNVGFLRQLADLCSVDMPIIPDDVELRLHACADEIARLTAYSRRSDDQWSEIAMRLDGDARNFMGDGEQTMAKFVVQEFDCLTAELARHKANDLECVQVIDRLTKERDDEHLACHEAREAARFVYDGCADPHVAFEASVRWPWLETNTKEEA